MTYGQPVWTDDSTAQLRALVEQGLSAREIGCEMGITRSAAMGKISRLGLKLSRRPSESKSISPVKRIKHLQRNGGAVVAGIMAAVKRAKAVSELPAAELTMLAPKPIARHPVALIDLEDDHCRWPLGTPGEEGFGFCGSPRRDEAVPYCGCHCRIAYHPLRNITEHERERRRQLGRRQVANGAWKCGFSSRGETDGL